MSTEGEKATVLRTTKVRTKLKGDFSWMNRNSEAEDQPAEEKPWLAEIRARRQNGAEASPVSSPTSTAPPAPRKSSSEKSPTSGFAIKGVFNKPASSSTSTSNGISETSKVTKKQSESYKKITHHTGKPTTENVDSKISSEEQLKRTAAASKVLNKSAAKERSYVLSAAKKFESQAAENSKESPSFVAKRVEIADDAPVRVELPFPVVPIESVTPVPEPPKTQNLVASSVKTSVVTVNEPPKVEVLPPTPAKEDLSPLQAMSRDPFEDMNQDDTKMAAALPELIADYLHVVSTHSERDDLGAADTHLVTISEEPEPLENSSSRVETLTAMYENLIPDDSNSSSLMDDEPGLAKEEERSADTRSEEGKEHDPTSALSNHEARTEELLNLISGQEEPELPVPPSPVHWSQDLHTEFEKDVHTEFESNTETVTITTRAVTITENREKKRDLSSSRVTTTVTEFSSADPFDPYPIGTTSPNSSSDLLQPLADISINSSSHTFIEKKEPKITKSQILESLAEDVIPIDTTTTRSSHTFIERERDEPKITRKSQILESLAEDVIPIDTTTTRSSHTFIERERDEPKITMKSQILESLAEDVISIDTTTTSSSHTFIERNEPKITMKSQILESLAEDVIPIDTTTTSSSHTFIERKEPKITLKSQILESLAEDVIPIDTTATSLSTHRWARTWETTTPLQTATEERHKAPGAGQWDEQQTLVTFERKSKEDDSPWDRWTSPSVYTLPTEEVESLEDSHMHTVTTLTTIRETYGEHEGLTMDRTVRVEAPRIPTPEPDIKKPFVYVKEYVDTGAMSSHNATGSFNSWSPSYSSSVSSPCTYCGQLVGNDAKITIEHLNINCHPHCFKCASCWKPMGNLIDNMFLRGGKVHCESCYAAAFD
ncbi:zinc finger protein 185 isoform X3 [Festucalex cinctus]